MGIIKNGLKAFLFAPVLDYESANSIAKFGVILDDKSQI